MAPSNPSVILMCGLPASGKTTTAGRLHRALGGALIRSCDVYAELGISLPDWVRRTAGFTRDTAAYEHERDRAYGEMARRLEAALGAPARPVIVDAVHGEREKRRTMCEIAWRYHDTPILLWCRCDSVEEVRRRFAARDGRDAIPEHEASDLSVFRHIASLWEDPRDDEAAAADAERGLVVYDTLADRVQPLDAGGRTMCDAFARVLHATAVV